MKVGGKNKGEGGRVGGKNEEGKLIGAQALQTSFQKPANDRGRRGLFLAYDRVPQQHSSSELACA